MRDDDRLWRERQLRAAVLAGDELAWRTWYDAYHGTVTAYVRWRCGGRVDFSEEVIQETWLTAVRRVRSFNPNQGSFQNWLFGIAANVVRNSLRKRRWFTAHSQSLNGQHDVKQPAIIAEPVDSAQRVAVALDQLSPRHEQVLRSKYLEGQSVQAIAEACGETPKTIESLLTRAREAFRLEFARVSQSDG